MNYSKTQKEVSLRIVIDSGLCSFQLCGGVDGR